MDMLREGVESLAETMSEAASTPVVYRFASGESATINATLGESSREQSVEDGLVNVARRMDVIVSVKDFRARFGASTKPREGDTVIIHGVEWQIRPFGGEPGVRYTDPHRTRHRIHLIEV